MFEALEEGGSSTFLSAIWSKYFAINNNLFTIY